MYYAAVLVTPGIWRVVDEMEHINIDHQRIEQWIHGTISRFAVPQSYSDSLEPWGHGATWASSRRVQSFPRR